MDVEGHIINFYTTPVKIFSGDGESHRLGENIYMFVKTKHLYYEHSLTNKLMK